MKKIFYLSVLICFLSCRTINSDINNLSYEEISIPISFPYMEQYESIGNIWCKENTFFFGGYNRHTHSIDIIDLTHQKTLSTISLEEQGPNAINHIRDLYIQDTLIICRNAMSFLTLNNKGEITSKWDINQIKDTSTHNYYLLNRGGVVLGNYKHFFYQSQSNTIFYQIYPISLQDDNSFAMAEFDLYKQKWQFLPIFYPLCFNKNVLYSDFSSLYILKKGNYFIYNYPYSCQLYCYDIISKKLNEYYLKSSFIPNEISLNKLPVSPKEKMKYELNSPRFGPIHAFEKLDIYIRIHYAPQKDKEATRKKYLMLFDKQFHVIGEYPLPENFRDKYYIAGNYIFFYLKDISENFFKIAQIDILKLINYNKS